MYIIVKRRRVLMWHYVVIGGNGQVLSSSETYFSKGNAKRAAKSLGSNLGIEFREEDSYERNPDMGAPLLKPKRVRKTPQRKAGTQQSSLHKGTSSTTLNGGVSDVKVSVNKPRKSRGTKDSPARLH